MRQEADTRITITIPASLRKILKVSAAKNDRSFSGEIVHCLKVATNWDGKNEKAGEAA